ncbi:MAG TPA: c-type cytochrome [Myxococcales bacterium]
MIALVLALLAQAPVPPPAPVQTGSAKEIFEKHCTLCHGADGRSQTKKGRQYKAPDFTSAKWQRSTDDEEIADAITNGVPKTKMKGFREKLSQEQIRALIPYLRAFGKK